MAWYTPYTPSRIAISSNAIRRSIAAPPVWSLPWLEYASIAPAAVHQVGHFGFDELGLHRLELLIDVENAASIRVAEKVGAVFDGVLRTAWWATKG
jgi:hypothetical protein